MSIVRETTIGLPSWTAEGAINPRLRILSQMFYIVRMFKLAKRWPRFHNTNGVTYYTIAIYRCVYRRFLAWSKQSLAESDELTPDMCDICFSITALLVYRMISRRKRINRKNYISIKCLITGNV